MSILLERKQNGHRTIEVWLCDSIEDIEDLPKSVPSGSFAFITTDDGPIVKIKNNAGQWKPWFGKEQQ